MPDNAAIARSDDGAKTFAKVFQFADTLGPFDCPKGTPVGDECPFYWETYGSQLGISFDGGASDGGITPPPPGCSCQLGAAPAAAGLVFALALPLALLFALRRRSRT
jgi:MYXO-CTERM domain-containing protein